MAKKRQSKQLHKKLKLSHHKHTGKRLPRHHTSYWALAVIVLFAGVMLLLVSRAFTANAEAITLDGSLNFSGFMPPPQPYPVATIESPLNNQVFGKVPIDIHGSCATYPDKVLVAVIDNGLNLGQALCDEGRYDFKIDLVISNRSGANFIRIRQYELLDDYRAAGIDSDVIKVYFHPDSRVSNQLIISAQTPNPSVKVGQAFSLRLNIHGGLAPYALSVNWGDGKEDIVSQPLAGNLSLSHSYQSADNYTIMVNASDSQNQKAYLQSSALVGGGKKAAVTAKTQPTIPYVGRGLAVLWPAFFLVTGYVVIFWIGEKYAIAKVMHQKLWKTHRP